MRQPLTEEVKEKISQGLIKFYKTEAGQARIRELKITPPPNKGVKGQIPWNKGKRGTCKHTPENRIRIGEANKKPILQYSKQGEFIKKWGSVKEAIKELGLSYPAIWYCATGHRKSAGGYKWSYK